MGKMGDEIGEKKPSGDQIPFLNVNLVFHFENAFDRVGKFCLLFGKCRIGMQFYKIIIFSF